VTAFSARIAGTRTEEFEKAAIYNIQFDTVNCHDCTPENTGLLW
jgi:hypothetical protein